MPAQEASFMFQNRFVIHQTSVYQINGSVKIPRLWQYPNGLAYELGSA